MTCDACGQRLQEKREYASLCGWDCYVKLCQMQAEYFGQPIPTEAEVRKDLREAWKKQLKAFEEFKK